MTRLEVLQHVDDGLPEFPLPGLISCHLAFECPRHCALKLKLSTLTEQKVCHAGASPFVPPDRSYPEPLTSPILAHTVLDHLTSILKPASARSRLCNPCTAVPAEWPHGTHKSIGSSGAEVLQENLKVPWISGTYQVFLRVSFPFPTCPPQ